MIDQLRNPSPGFESVVRNHFRIRGADICDTIQQWIDEDKHANLTTLLAEFKAELETL